MKRLLSGASEKALRWLVSKLYWRALRNFRFRQVVFDTAPPGTLLVAARSNETFLVMAGDKVIGRSLFVSGEFDFAKFGTVKRLLGDRWKGRLLIDVGANCGPICIPAIKRGYFSQALAIEPEPVNHSLLAANVQLNDLTSRITTRNVACGARDNESLVFELSATNLGDHRVRMRPDSGLMQEAERRTISVRSETLDSIIEEVDPSDTLIWIDTQGFEGYVLSGAPRALSRRVPLVIEFWPYAMQRVGSYTALKEALVAAGYEQYCDLDGSPDWIRLTPGRLDAMSAALEKRGPYAYTDLLLR
jgi:FkbM family methyltransferase